MTDPNGGTALHALLDDDPEERLSAIARAAGAIAAYALRDVVRSDPDADVRAAAALRLASFDDVPAELRVRALHDALYDTHASVRAAACRGLARAARDDGSAARAPAERALARLAMEEPIWWVRRAALLAFARLDRRRRVAVLGAALDDPFWRVRHAAARVLVALGERGEGIAVALADATPPSDRARAALAYVARRLPDGAKLLDASPPDARDAAPDTTLVDPDPAVVTARIEAGGRATAAELVLHLGDPHAPLRAAASARLAKAPDARALHLAVLWLEEPRIPHAAETVIALLDGLADVESLLDAALDGADARPGAAAWALSFVALRRRWDRLAAVVASLGAREPLVRRAAASALGAWLAAPPRGAREAARGVVDALAARVAADDDEDVRRVAMHALAGAASAEAWDAALRQPIADETALVQRLGVVAAAKADRRDVLAALARSADPATRAGALSALHERGALDADLAAEARASVDPWVRRAVLDEASAPAVLRDDPDPTLRRIALAASRGVAAARIAASAADPWLRAHAAERLARAARDDDDDLARVVALLRDPEHAVRAAAADVTLTCAAVPERLTPLTVGGLPRPPTPPFALRAKTPHSLRSVGGSSASRAVPPTSPIFARSLGRSGLVVSPLVISGVHEPPVASLFRAMHAGCNSFFWEPRHRALTAFLRNAPDARVVAGSYHASARAIADDIERARRTLRRARIDVFLLFWARSPARLDGEAREALERAKRDGLVGAIGFSSHDRALVEAAVRAHRAPWDVVMVRHSAAHPGAEDSLFAAAAAADVGVLGFSATSYARLLAPSPALAAPPSAADCYRYTLSQPGVSAVVSAPRGARELAENLAVLAAPSLDAARLAELRAHGRHVREESLDFARHVRRFPATPDVLADELLERDLAVATDPAFL